MKENIKVKPIVFWDVKKDDRFPGSVIINQEAFEKLLDQVYQAGVEDGKSRVAHNPFPQNTRDGLAPVHIEPTWTCDSITSAKKDNTYDHAIKTYLTSKMNDHESSRKDDIKL